MSIENIITDLQNLNIETPSTDSVSNTILETLVNISKNSIIKETEINLSTNILNEEDMSQFKPEYLKCVPVFDGNPNDLNRYISTCQSIIDSFYNLTTPQSFQNVYLLNSLVGKLTGQAKLIVNIQNVSTWDELKDTLRRNFADQRDEACLNRDLVMLKQFPNEKPGQFYDRVLHILNLLCSYIDAHETTTTAKTLKRSLYNDLALKTFLSGLKEPLGTTIRCMRPISLMQALQFVTQEDNIHYFQNRTKPNVVIQKNNNFKPFQNNSNINPMQSNFMARPNYNFSANNRPNPFRPSFPSQPINIRPNFNRPPPRYFTNSQVFGKPGNKTNVFKPNQQRQLPPQTAMSGVETSTFKPLPSTSNYNPPKLIFEEIYNTETQNIDQSEQVGYDENQFNPYDQYYYHDQLNYQPYESNEYYEPNVQPNVHTSLPDHDLVQHDKTYDESRENNANFCETPQENQPT